MTKSVDNIDKVAFLAVDVKSKEQQQKLVQFVLYFYIKISLLLDEIKKNSYYPCRQQYSFEIQSDLNYLLL